MTPADIIAQLEATTKRTEKEAIIKSAWDAGCMEFFEGARMAYFALETFGVKKVPLIEGEDDDNFESTFAWYKFKDIANKLEKRELTGNTARDVLRAAANAASVRDWNFWYRRILLKDLKCGITETTINKILEKVGAKAKKFIIPVFSCQLAKNGEDHPKKLSGPKMLDVKLDGVRIITILDIEKNSVTQYSRDGRQNDRFGAITDSLARLLPTLKQSLVLDGEMISRNFQELMKQVNRKENVDTSDAKLALFDVLPLADFLDGECKMTQTERHELLVGMMNILDEATNGKAYVIPKMSVDLDTDEGQTQLKEFNRETIDAGYEGIMIKDPAATYKTKRTDAWLKIKPWITVDLEIVAVEPGKPESKFANTLGGLVCKGVDQGKEIEVTVGGGYTEELRDEIWNNRDKMIGRVVEVKGDALTRAQDGDTWSLRFPVFVQFRGFEPHEKI
jgi:DNA ligase-1